MDQTAPAFACCDRRSRNVGISGISCVVGEDGVADMLVVVVVVFSVPGTVGGVDALHFASSRFALEVARNKMVPKSLKLLPRRLPISHLLDEMRDGLVLRVFDTFKKVDGRVDDTDLRHF